MTDTHFPTIEQAVEKFFNEFGFGDEGKRTRLSYRSGANAFLSFIDESEELDRESSISSLPASISTDFNTWLQQASHTGPGRPGDDDISRPAKGYSVSTRRLYLQALARLLYFWRHHNMITFSPEDEIYARKALQIQRSSDDQRSVQTRSDKVPTDFGNVMLKAAYKKLPLPTVAEAKSDNEFRKVRLDTLRARALIHVLRATALRAGDISSLARNDMVMAEQNAGYIKFEIAKTKKSAHIILGNYCFASIEEYLRERNDISPWLFIQHGSSGSPSKKKSVSVADFQRRQRGYGARLGTGTIRKIVIDLAMSAGYDPGKDEFVSTHAFRHWHAQKLIDLGASIDEVQSILGHARSETTKDVYAPEPNIVNIRKWEEDIQSFDIGIM